ncbi:efflux RND transporter periplasmic adaptor subunit [Novosphingobium nitrogenifigens]|uniref:efflux RND transporter periplasmic adaptor subunit n=1 Tax=Novosphingobium nitrogenifigens TaxID=378548 RepID=UPI00036A5EB7|nr:efflux RND transporter periplasmic adaptor subunit [Novosphingobium nitrogenifigens]
MAPLVLALAALSACNSQQSPPPAPIVVGVITAKAGAVPLMTELTGRTMASEVAEVRPQVAGIVIERLFTEGSNVRQGQALYQIDPRPYAATHDQAQAALANAQAVVESNRLKAERFRALVASGGISKQDAADAQATYNQSRAQVAAARATLAGAAVNLGYTRILAPISGRIGKTSVTKGALVTTDQTDAMAKIQRLDPIWVNIQQSSSDFIALRKALESGKLSSPGSAPVRIVLADGSMWPIEGHLDFADIDVNEETGTVTLRATVPNPNGDLLPGLFVKARLTQGIVTNGILVPQTAVGRDQRGNATVLVVGANDTVEQRTVTANTTFGPDWLITEGLRPGERVIVQGQLRARPGTKVKVVAAPANGG